MTEKNRARSDIKILRQNSNITSNFDFAASNSRFATGKFDLDTPDWSEVLCCTITTHISDLEVKVTDFEILS